MKDILHDQKGKAQDMSSPVALGWWSCGQESPCLVSSIIKLTPKATCTLCCFVRYVKLVNSGMEKAELIIKVGQSP